MADCGIELDERGDDDGFASRRARVVSSDASESRARRCAALGRLHRRLRSRIHSHLGRFVLVRHRAARRVRDLLGHARGAAPDQRAGSRLACPGGSAGDRQRRPNARQSDHVRDHGVRASLRAGRKFRDMDGHVDRVRREDAAALAEQGGRVGRSLGSPDRRASGCDRGDGTGRTRDRPALSAPPCCVPARTPR